MVWLGVFGGVGGVGGGVGGVDVVFEFWVFVRMFGWQF